MKRKEVKKAFEKTLKNINVSNELKVKTLNNIYSKNNVYHFPYIIRNCAAIFVVTCICLSVYLITNDKNTTENITLDEAISETNESNTSITSYEDYRILKSAPVKEYKATQNLSTTNEIKTESAFNKEASKMLMDSIEEASTETYIGLTEDEFLINNPGAKKIEEGYIILENEKEILYKIKGGIISEKIVK